jgi:hypothetical protein
LANGVGKYDVLLVGSYGYDGSNALALDALRAGLHIPMVRLYREFRIQPSLTDAVVLSGSDGIVVATETVRDYLCAVYGLEKARVLVFDSDLVSRDVAVSRSGLPRLSERDGEPHVVIGSTLKADQSEFDYREMIALLASQDIHVHVYPAAYSEWISPGRALNPDSAAVRREYQHLWDLDHVHLESAVRGARQLAEWSSYDLGIMQHRARRYVPSITPSLQMDRPSKYSYYLNSGLPLAVENGSLASLRALLAPYGVLLEYQSFEELATLLRAQKLLNRLRSNVTTHALRFTLETEQPAFESFLEAVLASGRRRPA